MSNGIYGRRTIFVLRPSLLLLASTSFAFTALSQDADSTRSRTVVAGAVTVTNNGIATVPSFTLGKPAAIFDMSVIRNRFSLDPQIKYALDGKPWSFIFWGHYIVADGERFRVIIGAHPGVNFRTTTVSVNQTQKEVIVARRYVAGDIYPSYSVSRYVSVGAYYLYSYGVEGDVAKHNHFLALRSTLSSTLLPGGYFVQVLPQVYYLKVDTSEGYYLYSGLAVGKRNFPLSIGAIVNKVIQTGVPGSEDFLWNLSVTYWIR